MYVCINTYIDTLFFDTLRGPVKGVKNDRFDTLTGEGVKGVNFDSLTP